MLIDNKFLLFGGKGGVGKTSCASATAVYAASKGKKTLVLSTDPAHSLADSFNKPIGGKITKLGDNLDGLEIDAGALLKKYKDKYGPLLRQIADEGTYFSKDEIQRFFDLSLPGMDELMALIEIVDIFEQDKYDLLVLDTAPTGHTIRLLELPELMTSYVRLLLEMRRKHKTIVSMMTRRYIKDKADEYIEKTNNDIERIKSTLRDSKKTRFVPITIPEAMSVYETEKLVNVLEKHQIPIGQIFVNRVMKENCDFCKSRKIDQEKYIREIRKKFSKYDVKKIPLFPNEVRGESLEVLSKVLYEDSYDLPEIKGKVSKTEFKFNPLSIEPGLEFLLFGGKGGVGKTSCASAVALCESKKRKVLIFSTDPAHSLSDSFDVKIGPRITKINNNLDALEIDSYALLEDLKVRYKNEITGFFNSVFKQSGGGKIDAPYDRKIMTDLFDLAPPGIDEIMALKTVMDLIEDRKNSGYGLFILDTAPSGHTIRLLEMPEIAESWLITISDIQESYPFSSEIGEVLEGMIQTIKKVKEIFTDSKRAEFVTVTIPEAMGLLETQDLIESLMRLKISARSLIINKIFPDSKCSFCTVKRSEQSNYVRKLQDLKLKTTGIELFNREIKGIKNLEALSKKLCG